MSVKDAHLYGAPHPRKSTSTKQISSSSSLSFASALSSLISTSTKTSKTTTTTTTSAGRPRPARKDDIFTSHNRNTKKRAAADMLTDPNSATARSQNSEMDEASWRRAKRKMEEKARLYAAMKRGDIEDDGEKHMVDFDRKWAERDDVLGGQLDSDQSSDGEGSDGDEEVVEFVDEFGRTRIGTRGEAAREERRRKALADDAPDRFTARPVQPTNLIFGDTVQTAAFNPDEPLAVQMEELAKKRGKELTPPPETHYDANAEVRSKGTGFFQFSADEEERKEQMANLERERQETERIRAERAAEAGKEAMGKDTNKRGSSNLPETRKTEADQFLDDLEAELVANGSVYSTTRNNS